MKVMQRDVIEEIVGEATPLKIVNNLKSGKLMQRDIIEEIVGETTPLKIVNDLKSVLEELMALE
eukprot:CAMPEP_0194185502 /NCGR_PEP_ID=MMETSP0154-20130528/42948_1 /TAXON_ID=1049557 /ORGANISM="Thalassiothrix antarctica, Strain L6-D1" /LENGTH=63 /DNA_ID=CAMNT_0038903877 /DNA_START=1 /DNA_END=189 /DNA_ORIENTATION=-